MASLREWRGLARSIRVYRLDRKHAQAMDRMYRRFVAPGDLVIDVGAHVGDRIASFRRLGARVAALEPQPVCAKFLRLMHGRDSSITLIEAAAGPAPGALDMHVNTRNPTVSTLSKDFVGASNGAAGWEGQTWDRTISIPVTSLDALRATHGEPVFIKIDVEGFEAQVLSGLTQAVPALSFEFTTIQRDVAIECLNMCDRLGYRRFNLALGESQTFSFPDAVSGLAMRNHIGTLPHEANSGDIYAFRDDWRARE
ncbi:MAG: FkbM family methyltransferase [Alphaproteobacteria bacterium]|nr:FkbM family methyltransferase [Alphaproteobacteria bacterium]